VLLFLMTGHWRSPIDLSEETLAQARAQVDSFRNAFLGAEFERLPGVFPAPFEVALDDDFNTAAALALMHGWKDDRRLDLIYPCLHVFGLASLAEEEAAPPELVALAEARQKAREARDFTKADELRSLIEADGWEVRDIWNGFRLVPKR